MNFDLGNDLFPIDISPSALFYFGLYGHCISPKSTEWKNYECILLISRIFGLMKVIGGLVFDKSTEKQQINQVKSIFWK